LDSPGKYVVKQTSHDTPTRKGRKMEAFFLTSKESKKLDRPSRPTEKCGEGGPDGNLSTQ